MKTQFVDFSFYTPIPGDAVHGPSNVNFCEIDANGLIIDAKGDHRLEGASIGPGTLAALKAGSYVYHVTLSNGQSVCSVYARPQYVPMTAQEERDIQRAESGYPD